MYSGFGTLFWEVLFKNWEQNGSTEFEQGKGFVPD
jgi:hypothetical protein